MSRSRNKSMMLLVLAVFVWALGGCVFACASADSDCADDHSYQCLCVCQTLAVSHPLTAAPQPILDAEELIAAPARLKLELFAASIFNPPKA